LKQEVTDTAPHMLVVTTDTYHFKLTPAESLDLEIKLNVTSKGNVWKEIGDRLFANGPEWEMLVVTNEQYDFLNLLRERKSYKDCYDL
jgi:hypothetical protein